MAAPALESFVFLLRTTSTPYGALIVTGPVICHVVCDMYLTHQTTPIKPPSIKPKTPQKTQVLISPFLSSPPIPLPMMQTRKMRKVFTTQEKTKR